jgi:hypothetical protein
MFKCRLPDIYFGAATVRFSILATYYWLSFGTMNLGTIDGGTAFVQDELQPEAKGVRHFLRQIVSPKCGIA